jgi:hypothetical protein
MASASNYLNLPKDLILQIIQYLDNLTKRELRLTNKHWSFYVTPDCLITHQKSLNFTSLVTSQSSNVVKFSNSYATNDLVYIPKFQNIKELEWHCSEDNLRNLNQILGRWTTLRALDLKFWLMESLTSKLMVAEISSKIGKLPNLKVLKITFHHDLYFPILDALEFSSVKSLIIDISPAYYTNAISKISKLNNLESLVFRLSFISHRLEGIKGEDLPIPEQFLNLTNLKKLSIWISSCPLDLIQASRYSEVLINTFNSAKFRKLKEFEWKMWDNYSDSIDKFYYCPLSALISSKLTNLTKLSLTAIDSHLLAFLLQSCPHLVELCFKSPLVFPHSITTSSLSSTMRFNHLKKLFFATFSSKLVDNPQIIRYLFPKVTTLYLAGIVDFYVESSTDINLIPLLFPQVKKLILSSLIYELELLKPNKDIKWEELFIQMSKPNIKINSLIDKIPTLKFFYFSLPSNLNYKPKLNKQNLIIYSCYSIILFNFNIKFNNKINYSNWEKIKIN